MPSSSTAAAKGSRWNATNPPKFNSNPSLANRFHGLVTGLLRSQVERENNQRKSSEFIVKVYLTSREKVFLLRPFLSKHSFALFPAISSITLRLDGARGKGRSSDDEINVDCLRHIFVASSCSDCFAGCVFIFMTFNENRAEYGANDFTYVCK